MAADDSRTLRMVRVFDAPRELVYQSWLQPEHLAAWFAPDGHTVTSCAMDARPGGRWRISYRSARDAHVEEGELVELVPPERLVMTLTQSDDRGRVGPRTTVTVTLVERGERTEMTFVQTGFDTAVRRDSNAEGWGECFRKLEEHLAERELHALFDAWSRASEARDLDAAMAPVAPDVVSYEHELPLAVTGASAVREICRRGFDAATGELRWDVPDLRVLVRGDLAVTWGLNRIRVAGAVVWSRGTRVFQKVDGAWKMIHQHVSFPYDPATGRAKTDAAP